MRPLDEHLRQACEERAPAARSASGLARRFLAPPVEARVLALQALFASLRGVPDGVSEPAVGLAKLAWWENELREAGSGASSRHPVVVALRRTGALEQLGSVLSAAYFAAVAARIDAPPFRSFDELDDWLCATHGTETRLLDAYRGPGAPATRLERMGAGAGLLEQIERWSPGADRPSWVPLELLARAGAPAGRDRGLRAGIVAELAAAALCRLDATAATAGSADAGDDGVCPGPFIAARDAVVRRRLDRLRHHPERPARAGMPGIGDVFAAWSTARRHRRAS